MDESALTNVDTVAVPQFRSSDRAPQDDQLLSQSQVFRGQTGPRDQARPEQRKEQMQSTHRSDLRLEFNREVPLHE